MMNGLTLEQLQALVPGIQLIGALSSVYSLLSIGVYLIGAYSLYVIAKRRFIDHAWLAWIPIGYIWILGSIADHYRLCALGQIKSRRKVLMATCIAMAVMIVAMIVVCFAAMKNLLGVMDLATGRIVGDWQAAIGSNLIWLAVLYLLMIAASIVQVVFMYIAYYDLFVSCDPRNAVIYLVLSIVFSMLLPVFLFACRHKENGLMPSRRKPAPPAAEPWQ